MPTNHIIVDIVSLSFEKRLYRAFSWKKKYTQHETELYTINCAETINNHATNSPLLLRRTFEQKLHSRNTREAYSRFKHCNNYDTSTHFFDRFCMRKSFIEYSVKAFFYVFFLCFFQSEYLMHDKHIMQRDNRHYFTINMKRV